MAKYKIAWLPGDGIGKDVMEAARIVLNKMSFDAEYIPGDVGWEFWKSEGNPLPERTVDLLKNTDCCLFGAITSKPKEEAEAELHPALVGKGYVYYSPIVKIRQQFNLRTNLRPCKAFEGNPLNYKDGIDLVVFRENTEDLYSGVEFHPLPPEVMEVLLKHHQRMKKFEKTKLEDIAVSLRIVTRKAAQNITRDAFEYAEKHRRKSVTIVEK
ncbi:MAG: 3-isopropylmalate dehydrogenase, partial [candidate division Zixibacteria bacterium SM23_73_2]